MAHIPMKIFIPVILDTKKSTSKEGRSKTFFKPIIFIPKIESKIITIIRKVKGEKRPVYSNDKGACLSLTWDKTKEYLFAGSEAIKEIKIPFSLFSNLAGHKILNFWKFICLIKANRLNAI